ncbi:MAG: rhodanese-like domain-containing protein [Methylovulum sp.]|uniref:rhodanese-like domain-containing protein n=1 Tax=Methylovulum sp. TaxID=1916980 RepID=UPI00263091AD|nr:rhodanese-like domain-containing protein [Methylovulum sp.]MDD2724655.1 rhodanese-like domain-containing protein [Methylovulum sp.]MDD5123482.1 rhodanese-like domain-containing protein [Methylovulum sp.]
MTVKTITAIELKTRLEQGEPLFLLDVREDYEYKYASIPNSVLIPQNKIPERINELDAGQAIVVICHHGMRSKRAANYLVSVGFNDVTNLEGGIDAWSLYCDSSVPRYA